MISTTYRFVAGLVALRRRLHHLVGLILTLLALAACATVPQQTDPLVTRAQARWDAVVAGQYELAYAYYSPGFRSATPVIDFVIEMRTKRVRWTGATYRDHSCQDQTCKVRFDIQFQVSKPVPGVDKYDGQAVTEDTWVKSGGEWWYLPKK